MSVQRSLTCVVLVTLAAAAWSTPRKHNVEPLKENNGLSEFNRVSPSNVNLSDNDVNIESTLNPRPINERIPSAVLFGRTCGGTIISPTWILSAGHCTLFTNGRDIIAGTNNTENGSGVRIRVKRMVIHPLFTVGPYWLDAEQFNFRQVAARYDFLLAELEKPLPIDGKTIAVAALDDRTRLTPGENVEFAGYGAEHFKEVMRHDMHINELQVLSDADCSTLEQYDSKDMLCAKGKHPRFDSACNGDSGSGLVQNGRVLGVASWVEDDALTCRAGTKVVFSRVASARDWIKKVIST